MSVRCVSNVGELRRLLQQSELAERKAFIKSFVREIVVRGNQAELRYVLPLGSGGASGRLHGDTVALTDGVLASVHASGAGGTRTPDFLRAKEALSQTELQPHVEATARVGHGKQQFYTRALKRRLSLGPSPKVRGDFMARTPGCSRGPENTKHLNRWIVKGNQIFQKRS